MVYFVELTEEQIELLENLTNLEIGTDEGYDQDNAKCALGIVLETF